MLLSYVTRLALLALWLAPWAGPAAAQSKCRPNSEEVGRERQGNEIVVKCRCLPGFRLHEGRDCVPIGTTCEVCHTHLHASVRVRAGGNPTYLRTYVQQAINSYQNCKAKARGSCVQGDQLVVNLKICDRFDQAGYVACAKQGVGLQP